jgi:hypothetical protein
LIMPNLGEPVCRQDFPIGGIALRFTLGTACN